MKTSGPALIRTSRHDDAPYHGHTAVYGAVLAAALLMLAGLTYLAVTGSIRGWEYEVFQAVNGLPEAWYRPMTVITFFGSMWGVVLAVALAFMVRLYRLAWRLALASLVAFGIVQLMKTLVSVPRPDGLFNDTLVRFAETGMGFPSGHVTAVTVVLLMLIPYITWQWRWLLAIGIAAVALSRMYLGVHSPVDVAGGVALGSAIVAALRVLPQSVKVLCKLD